MKVWIGITIHSKKISSFLKYKTGRTKLSFVFKETLCPCALSVFCTVGKELKDSKQRSVS